MCRGFSTFDSLSNILVPYLIYFSQATAKIQDSKFNCSFFFLAKYILINKFFEIDLTIKVNAKRERRFDRPTVIFKFKMRSKICGYIYIQL